MSVRADAETLRRIPLFQDCDTVPLQILAFSSERLTIGLKEQVLRQGYATENAYLVLSGLFNLIVDGAVVGVAAPGTFLGETAMIGGTKSSLTAEADQLSYVASISRATFNRVAEEYPDFGATVLQSINARVTASLHEFDAVRDLLIQAKSFSEI